MLQVLATLWTVSLLVLGAALCAVIVGQNTARLLRTVRARVSERRGGAVFSAPHPSSS